jgi:hypothetical protein
MQLIGLPQKVIMTKADAVDWVCHSCGIKHGGWYKDDSTYVGPRRHCATYHHGICGICNITNIAVTEPRDYGYLTRNLENINVN